MTAPFAPPPHPVLLIVIGVAICFAAAMPFVRRDDWLGWAAFAVMIAVNMILWGVLLRAAWQRIRGDRDS